MEQAFGLTIPRTLEDVCHPAEMALLVYDMQVGIVSQVADGPGIVARVGEVLASARSCGMRVCYTRHLSLPREFMGSFQHRMAMIWQRVDRADEVRPWFLRDSPGFRLVPELAPRDSEVIFDKLAMSAFEGTPLSIALRDCGLVSFAIAGIATEIGIEPTVRHGSDLGFIPIVVQDACGAGHHEAAERAMANMAYMGDAFLCDSRELLAIWNG